MTKHITNALLWICLVLGLFGALNVSWQTYTQVSPCPAIGGLRVCYLILACYLLMAVAMFLHGRKQKVIFYGAWIIVFGFAVLASVLELNNGHTCPKSSSGFAMCYVSLIYSVVIGAAFSYRAWWSKSH